MELEIALTHRPAMADPPNMSNSPSNQDLAVSPSHPTLDLPSVELPPNTTSYQPTNQTFVPDTLQNQAHPYYTADQQPQVVTPYNPDLSSATQYPPLEQPPSNTATYSPPPYQYPNQTTLPYPIEQGDPAYLPPKVDESEPPPPYPGPPSGVKYGDGNSFQSATPPGMTTGQPQQPGVNAYRQPPSNVTIVRTVQVDHNGQAVNSYLSLSIFSIFCCLCFGIIATIKSANVNSLVAQGRYVEARRVSTQARTWATVAIVFGLFSLFTNILRMIVS